jgi:FMN reductase
MTIHILGLSGSLAERSTTRAAVATALSGARTKTDVDVTTELLSVRELALPLYDPDQHGPGKPVPKGARRLCDAVENADGLIWASPLYHGTVSGAFKNALDWLELLAAAEPPYLTEKVVGLVSTAGGVQGLQAVNTMEFAVRALRGWAVPLVVPIPQAHTAFNGNGSPTDDNVARQLRALGAEVARASRQLRTTGTCDYAAGHHEQAALAAIGGVPWGL